MISKKHEEPLAVGKVHILLVEDSPSDARLTLEALKEGRARMEVHHVSDGEEAIAYVRRQGAYSSANRPHLVLLDLNLPRRSGLDVLREIKQDEALRSIPVVVLTTSQDERDVSACYGSSANCYVNKPVDLDVFMELVRTIDHFFFSVVTLPPNR